MPLTPEALYMQLGRLLAEMPSFLYIGESTAEDRQRWLGRAVALLEASQDVHNGVAALALKAAGDIVDHLDGAKRRTQAMKIATIMHRALARAELRAPAPVQGAFIPAGNSFEAFAAVGKVLSAATEDILIVDPYADEKLLMHFAAQAPEGCVVRVLTGAHHHKPTLRPAADRWLKQFGPARPLEVRLAEIALHDRLIVVDNGTVWMVGQSFKDLAEKAPTSIVRVDPETAALKISAYADMWKAAKPF